MFNLDNKQYDVAKDATTVYIPAAATFYAALSGIWGLPYSVEIVGSAAALVTFLGVVLKINTKKFGETNTMVADADIHALEMAPAGITLDSIQAAPDFYHVDGIVEDGGNPPANN